MRSRTWAFGALTRSVDASLSRATTSWKVENQTASETCARRTWASGCPQLLVVAHLHLPLGYVTRVHNLVHTVWTMLG